MEKNDYQLAGKVHIPKERREEFSRKVLEVLDRGGIRITEEIQLGGTSLTVVRKAEPSEEGIVSFNYSVFEKEKRGVATLHLKTGKLKVPDRGYCEYGVVLNMVMVLLQAYSDSPCYLTNQGKPIDVAPYLTALETLLGEPVSCKNGLDIWEVLSFFHESPEHDDLSIHDAFRVLRWEGNPAAMRQLRFLIPLDDDPVTLTEEVAIMDRTGMRKAKHWQQMEYLYRTIQRNVDTEGSPDWLVNLLQCELDERKKLAEREDDLGVIAECSLRFSAQGVANLYAKAKGESFWTVWDRLRIRGYEEILEEENTKSDSESETQSESTSEKARKLPLYRIIHRDCEDEFLEWWDGENLILSEELQKQLLEWKEEVEQTRVPQEMDVAGELRDILFEMKSYYGCRYVDSSFVEAFLSHKEDRDYWKLLLVLRGFLDQGIEYFPELTRQQAKEWVLKYRRPKEDAILMSAFASLVTNDAQRLRLFGI